MNVSDLVQIDGADISKASKWIRTILLALEYFAVVSVKPA